MKVLLSLMISFSSLAFLACQSSPSNQADNAPVSPWEEWESVLPFTPNEDRNPAANLEAFSVNDSHLKSAICRETYAKGTPEVLDYFKKLPRNYEETVSGEIAGISFKDERPDLLETFWRLTTAAESNPEEIAGNLAVKYSIGRDCTKVICASQAVFGNHVGPKMLYLMHKFSINTSPFSWQNADTFTDGELVDIIKGLELIPNNQLPTSLNQKMIRFKRGYIRKGNSKSEGRTVANSTMEFFDPFEEESTLERQHTLVHEVGHIFADTIFKDLDIHNAWISLGGWKAVSPSDYKIAVAANLKGDSFVSQYAQAAPWEDFAETAVAYRLNPSWLKARSQKKYEFMRIVVFDGVEFTGPASCKKPKLSQKLIADFKKNEPKFSEDDLAKIKQYCRADIQTALFGFLPHSFFNRCVNFEASLIWLERNPRFFESIIPNGVFNREFRSSQLNFPNVQKAVKAMLVPEVTVALKEALDSHSRLTLKDETTPAYCADFAKSKTRHMRPDHDSIMRKFESTKDNHKIFEAAESKVYGLCLDVFNGYAPKGTGAGFVAYLKSLVLQKPEERIRGVTLEQVQTLINDKLSFL